MAEQKEETYDSQFIQFIEDYKIGRGYPYEKKISLLVTEGKRSLTVDYTDLYAYDIGLAVKVLNNPILMLKEFGVAVFQKMRPSLSPLDAEQLRAYEEKENVITVRFNKVPNLVSLRHLEAAHIGTMITVTGIVVSTRVPYPKLTKAVFRCMTPGCKTVSNELVQPYEFLFPTPGECPNCKGNMWIVDPMLSTYTNVQEVKIQERPEELPPGQLPHSIKVLLKDDLVNTVNPGDRVTLTCIVSAKQVKPKSLEMELLLEGNYVEQIAPGQESMEMSPEDLDKIKELAADPYIFNKLVESMAPSIYGHRYIKEAMAEALFGGVPKQIGTTRIRGDVDVLMVGDPGTAKSQMLERAARLAPRGLLTTGRGSTAAGLTAAAIQERGGGGFVLEAGALVLADKGVCCIDEIDKMRDEDRGAIHPAMEQQVVSIAKGGIVATLNARTAVIAAANPTLGRYNPYQTITENITLSVPLLNRFDTIFVMRDEPNPERDAEMADHILRMHRAPEEMKAPIPDELLRKYINSAKAITPTLTDEAVKMLRDFYLKLRAASVDSTIMITARQLESLIRQSEARARARHSKEVTEEDAMGVIALMNNVMTQIGIDPETGQPDLDIILTGKPKSLQDKLQRLLTVIREMSVNTAVRDDDLYEVLQSDHGMALSESARLVGILMRDGAIFSPRPGFYKAIS